MLLLVVYLLLSSDYLHQVQFLSEQIEIGLLQEVTEFHAKVPVHVDYHEGCSILLDLLVFGEFSVNDEGLLGQRNIRPNRLIVETVLMKGVSEDVLVLFENRFLLFVGQHQSPLLLILD